MKVLRKAVTVGCAAPAAFDTWTRRIDLWWPRDHTVGGEAVTEVVLEPRVGGRLFERHADGAERDWGAVTTWEPPQRFAYTWHIGADADEATRVEITFTELDGGTRVDVAHTGWESVTDGDARMQRNESGWEGLLPAFVAASESD